MTEKVETRQQHRRDFRADYECEGCGHIEKDVSGYDDTNFHTNVIPNLPCKECGETTLTLNKDIINNTVIPAGLTL